MNIELFVQYFLATAILFDASIAWFVLLKNPKRAINQAYFFMVFWITIWQVGDYLINYIVLPPEEDEDTEEHKEEQRFRQETRKIRV